MFNLRPRAYPCSSLLALVLGGAVCAGVVPVVTPVLHAQVTTGNLVGVVKDPSGASVPNVQLTVQNIATGVATKTTTNSQGEYRVPNLLPGNYTVSAVTPGFSATKVDNVTVTLNATATQDINLALGSANATVEVSGEAGVVLDTTSENLTQTFEPIELSTLPVAAVGEGVLNTSLLVPGVGSTGGIGIGVGPSVAGLRQRDNNFMIEGIDNNNKAVTGPLVYVPNDAVREFTLITTQFSPEFGHSAGAQFNTDVYSGTNTFHGRLYEYFQNRNLNAALVSNGSKQPNTRYDNNRYGGQLGGPIVHNKLFFFVNYERNTIGQSIQNSLCVPSDAGRAAIQNFSSEAGFSQNNIAQFLKFVPSANDTNAADTAAVCGVTSTAVTSGPADSNLNQTGTPQGSIPFAVYQVNAPTYANHDALVTSGDYTISDSDTLRIRYIYNTVPAFDTAANIPAFFVSNPFKYHLVAISEFHNFTPHLINEFRLGYNRYANTTVVGPQTFPGLDSFPNLQFYDEGSIQVGPDPNAPQFTIQNLYQVTDNVTYTKGRHTIVMGFDGRKYISPQGFTQRARGDYEYSYLSDYLHDYAPDPNGLGQRSTGNHTYYGDQTAFYGYVNDTFRATDTVTINAGLRYEFTSVPVGERSQSLNAIASVPGLINFGVPQPSYTAFAPRVGIEWAPDSKTSVRAGFGMAYDVLFDNLGTLSFPPEYSVTQDITSPGYPQPGSANFLANGGLKPGTGSGTTTFPTAAAARAATGAYIPNQILPYTESYTLTIQHQLGRGLTGEIGYVGDHGVHLPVQQRINIQPETTPQNYLPTYLNGVAIDGQGPNATTLAAIKASPTKYFVPAFYNAGFTGSIVGFTPLGMSNYNGLIANLQGRMKNGLQMQLSYTYSKTMDNATAEVFATTLSPRRPENPQDFRSEYARSGLDHTNRLTLEADYNFQLSKAHGWFVRNMVGNWVVSPIYTYESPEYATVLNGGNPLLTNDGAYVGRTIVNPRGVKGTASLVTPVLDGNGNTVGYNAVNPNAYYIQAGSGTLSTNSRNTLAGRPTDNLDFSAYKRFSAFERYTLEVGAQAYNVLNHAQYIPGSVDDVGTYSYTGTTYQTIVASGQLNSKFNQPQFNFGNNPRTMQLSAKFIF